MYKTSFRVSLLVIVLMLPWAVVQAAGLGKLTLNSALGQPLAAEIEIVTTSSDDVASLKASVATREAFAQAGINYESVLSAVKASVELRSNGNPYIKLTSPQAVNDPFLMILMELSWSSGRILREYTVLLDPVETNTQNLAAASTGSTPAIVTTRLDEERAPSAEKDNPTANSSPKRKNNAAGQTKKSYGPVKRGDTLSSIARQVSPAGVDLNQMLVALYHANRDAFIADNMNLLKAGAVLKIPEKNEIASIDTTTAKTEIKMQTADWRSYRGKLADISRESPASRTISQSDQGQITTTLDKKSAAAPSASKEVLKLSSGAQLPDKDGKTPDANLVDRLRMMEEDAIARNLALKEANERVAMLEKSIDNLKQLLELKDSVLAQAQLKAEPASKTTVKPEIQTATAVDTIAEKGPKQESESIVVQEIPAAQLAPEAAKTAPVTPLPLPSEDAESQSWVDLLLNYIEYIAAASVLGLSLILLMMKRRRNQLEEASEEGEDKKENFSSAMRSRMATMTAAQAATDAAADVSGAEHEEDDLTYQNINASSEDEEFDKDAQYYEDNVAKYDSVSELPVDDEQSANELQQDEQPIDENVQDNFAEEYGQSDDSDQDSTTPANQIDFDLSDEATDAKHQVAANQSSIGDEAGLSSAAEDLRAPESTSDYALEINFDDSEKSLDSVNLNDDEKIDFDLGDSDIDFTEDKTVNEIEVPSLDDESIAIDSSEKFSGLDEPLEFDSSLDVAHEAIEPELESNIPDLAGIDLNLGDSAQESEKDENPDLGEKSEQWQEVETKLDLAKAYQEMDDKEGAKEMLEEVIRDGDDKQKKAAKKMLKSL
ncbi:MAG: fimbrial protein FimV [Nitrosomonas oligotropha]|uniref:Fimbrial protein FimV n=1 Tax=Nitrosomonas oligotropha TaxID=42354 RepID=A0A5C7VVE9_9PROT|nr:MAG: fimbrial protein FimV [Nitrosomonas oligotropha]